MVTEQEEISKMEVSLTGARLSTLIVILDAAIPPVLPQTRTVACLLQDAAVTARRLNSDDAMKL